MERNNESLPEVRACPITFGMSELGLKCLEYECAWYIDEARDCCIRAMAICWGVMTGSMLEDKK